MAACTNCAAGECHEYMDHCPLADALQRATEAERIAAEQHAIFVEMERLLPELLQTKQLLETLTTRATAADARADALAAVLIDQMTMHIGKSREDGTFACCRACDGDCLDESGASGCSEEACPVGAALAAHRARGS